MKYSIGVLILIIYSNMINNNDALIKTTISVNKTTYKIGETIELNFKINNIGNESFTFLPWGTPLENRLTGSCLDIIYKNKTIEYEGIMKKRRAPIEEDYIVLSKNETATGKVNILKDYKLNKKGVYHIQFKETHGIPTSNSITIKIN